MDHPIPASIRDFVVVNKNKWTCQLFDIDILAGHRVTNVMDYEDGSDYNYGKNIRNNEKEPEKETLEDEEYVEFSLSRPQHC